MGKHKTKGSESTSRSESARKKSKEKKNSREKKKEKERKKEKTDEKEKKNEKTEEKKSRNKERSTSRSKTKGSPKEGDTTSDNYKSSARSLGSHSEEKVTLSDYDDLLAALANSQLYPAGNNSRPCTALRSMQKARKQDPPTMDEWSMLSRMSSAMCGEGHTTMLSSKMVKQVLVVLVDKEVLTEEQVEKIETRLNVGGGDTSEHDFTLLLYAINKSS